MGEGRSDLHRSVPGSGLSTVTEHTIFFASWFEALRRFRIGTEKSDRACCKWVTLSLALLRVARSCLVSQEAIETFLSSRGFAHGWELIRDDARLMVELTA